MQVPAKIGPYDVEQELGRGAMGIVLQARHRELGVVRALKLVKAGRQDRVERFNREVQSLAKVQHPNVVGVHESGRLPDGSLYYAMDRVEGRALSEELSRRGALPFGVALETALGIARGVEALHKAGIVHRDLKPDNVVLDAGGRPVVLDLGLAVDPESDERLTQTGAFVGTPAYMAPEQVDGRRDDVSPRIDVYALGLIVFELFTGEPAVEGGSQVELIGQILSTDRPQPTSVDPDLPLALDVVCSRAMARNPSERYADAGELANALAQLSESSGRTRRQKRRLTAVCVSALLLVSGALAVVIASADDGAVATKKTPRQRRTPKPVKRGLDPREIERGDRGLRKLRRLVRESDETRAQVEAEATAWLEEFEGHPHEAEARAIARQAPYASPLCSISIALPPSQAEYGAEGVLLDKGRKVLFSFRKSAWIVDVETKRRVDVDLPDTIQSWVRLPDGGVLVALVREAYRVDPSGATVRVCALPAASVSLALSDDGKRLALGARPPNAYVVDLTSGEVLQTLGGHESSSYGVCFLDDDRVATVSGEVDLITVQVRDCALRVFSVRTGALTGKQTLHGRGTRVLPSLDRKRLFAGDDLGRILIFDAETLAKAGQLVGLNNETTQVEHASLAHNQSVRFMKYSGDRRRIYTGAGGDRNRLAGNTFAIWDATREVELARYPYGRKIESYDVASGPDGRGDRLLIVDRKGAQVWLLDPALKAGD